MSWVWSARIEVDELDVYSGDATDFVVGVEGDFDGVYTELCLEDDVGSVESPGGLLEVGHEGCYGVLHPFACAWIAEKSAGDDPSEVSELGVVGHTSTVPGPPLFVKVLVEVYEEVFFYAFEGCCGEVRVEAGLIVEPDDDVVVCVSYGYSAFSGYSFEPPDVVVSGVKPSRDLQVGVDACYEGDRVVGWFGVTHD